MNNPSPWLEFWIFQALKKIPPELVATRKIINTINTDIFTLIVGPAQKPDKPHYSTVFRYKNVTWFYDYKLKSFYDDEGKAYRKSRLKVTPDGEIKTQQMRIPITTNISNEIQASISWWASLCHSIDAQIVEEVVRICREEHLFTPITICDCFIFPFDKKDIVKIVLNKSHSNVFKSHQNDSDITNKVWLEEVWLNPTLENLKNLNDKPNEKQLLEIKGKWDGLWLSNKNISENKMRAISEIFRAKHHYTLEI